MPAAIKLYDPQDLGENTSARSARYPVNTSRRSTVDRLVIVFNNTRIVKAAGQATPSLGVF